MEEAAARIAQDNCELACCFIQKTAVEKAGPEMDKRLATVSEFVVWFIQSTLLQHKRMWFYIESISPATL